MCPLSQTILLLEGIHSPTTGQSSKEAASSFADGALAPERAPASQSDTFAVQLAAPQPTPLFDRVDVQTAARSGSEADLPALTRDEINQCHCPVCRYKCENNMYPARHACKQRPAIARAEAEVRQWAQGRSGVGQPCRWCQVGYKQTSKAHQRACPVLWACGHLQHAFHTLRPSGQTDLRRHVRRADTGNPASSPGASAVRGGYVRKPDNLFSHNCPFRRPAHLLPRGRRLTRRTPRSAQWQKASGKGDGNQGDQAVQDQRSQDRARGLASFRRGGQRPWWKEEGETPARAGPHTPVDAIRMEISHP